MNKTTTSTNDRLANSPALLAMLRQYTGRSAPRANLTFSQAVGMMLQSKKLCRLDWPNERHYVALLPAFQGQVRLTLQSGHTFDYLLTPDDLTSRDWYVVEEA